jgi:hypothetical protein
MCEPMYPPPPVTKTFFFMLFPVDLPLSIAS